MSPFSTKIPLRTATYRELESLSSFPQSQFFEIAQGSFALAFNTRLEVLLEDTIPNFLHGVGEDRMYQVVAPVITAPLMFLNAHTNINLEYACNAAETSRGKRSRSTVLENKRPDYLFFHKHMLVLRGELKDTESQIETALKELADKMLNWNNIIFGDLPYLFAFAAAGRDFRLCALYGDNGKTKLMEITRFNLLLRRDRIRLFIHVINIFLIIGMMGPIIPDDAPEMFKVHRSSMNNSIYIDSDHIKKDCTGYTEWTRLRELYQLIDSNEEEFPYLIRPYYKTHFDEFYKETHGILTLYLKPLGYDTYPQTGEELIYCLECVLRALWALHKHDWVHRDVRWPNILKLEDKSWMLIDLENAVPKGDDGTFANVPSVFQDCNKSPRSKEQLNWLPCDDIWMVGNLVLSLQINKYHAETVSEKLLTFAKQLTTQNYSAKQALELIKSLKVSP